MSLKDATPILDDRGYADIIDECRTRVPRYASEWQPTWTDLNDSDPGTILTQVFAWLADMLLYRMGRVPELNYIKFLELIGIELIPALPSRAEVCLAVAPDHPAPYVHVPKGTRLAATGPEGTTVDFETERDLRALACTLTSVQSFDGSVYQDLSRANDDAKDPFEPFGSRADVGAAIVFGLAFPDGHPNLDAFPPGAIDFTIWTRPADAAPPSHRCGPGDTRTFASAQIIWEAWSGKDWQRLDSLSDGTVAMSRSGHWLIRVPRSAVLQRDYLGIYRASDSEAGELRAPLFWLRARVADGRFERAPQLRAIRLNTVPAVQARTVREEILGGADGRRNQRFQLANKPVLPESLVVTIDDGIGERRWTIVADLLASGPTDEHLALNPTTGELAAGDGRNGAIPVANIHAPDSNVIAREYRYGGGRTGNVPAGAIRNLVGTIPGIDAGKTHNLFAAFGGSDEESLDEAKKRARGQLRARDRAVTAEDFEVLALSAGNVGRAKALPLAHPGFPGARVPGAVTVIVVPDSDDPAPTPSDGLLRTVCATLDTYRLLTTEVHVVAPRYVPVQVRTQVIARDDADPDRVKDAVEAALAAYLHPLVGGDDGSGWPFGGTVRYSKVLHRVFAVDGVDSVPDLSLVVDGEEHEPCRDISIAAIAADALVYSTDHQIEVVPAAEAGEP